MSQAGFVSGRAGAASFGQQGGDGGSLGGQGQRGELSSRAQVWPWWVWMKGSVPRVSLSRSVHSNALGTPDYCGVNSD